MQQCGQPSSTQDMSAIGNANRAYDNYTSGEAQENNKVEDELEERIPGRGICHTFG